MKIERTAKEIIGSIFFIKKKQKIKKRGKQNVPFIVIHCLLIFVKC